jgi:ABC-type nickel/cobalt efflux system permease component RcnA
VQVFDTNAFSDSLTGALSEALRSLPASGPLDERDIHLSFTRGSLPMGAKLIAARAAGTSAGAGSADTAGAAPGAGSAHVAAGSAARLEDGADSAWIERQTRRLIGVVSAPTVAPQVELMALLGALLLGAVHALSPGHGKTIVGAYLIGSRGTARHAAFLGLTVTITHTLGVFVLGFAALYASRFIVPERLFPILSLVSALLVLIMGVVLLAQRARTARQALSRHPIAPQVFQPVMQAAAGQGRGLLLAQRGAEVWHSHGGGPMHSHLPPGAAGEKITWRSLLALGISGGLVPCPSAMVLLLAAVALNKTAYGMLLVVAFSLGLALTLTLIGLAFLYARNRLRPARAGSRWQQLLPMFSAAMITVLGIGLVFAAIKGF